MNPTNKVQTNQTFTAWLEEQKAVRKIYDHEVDSLREGWNAALDSVILPEGKRFEVGDEALAVVDGTERNGTIEFVTHYQQVINLASKDVHPLPQTVELTAKEKLWAVEQEMVKRGDESLAAARVIATKLATGKTLDQLCKEYNVPTMREVP
jgi:hypothetical protein